VSIDSAISSLISAESEILMKSEMHAGEETVSSLGRFVVIMWLLVVLIITQSYTASLTSILTVQQLSTGIQGINNLID
jgi:hypothetical protein